MTSKFLVPVCSQMEKQIAELFEQLLIADEAVHTSSLSLRLMFYFLTPGHTICINRKQ